MAAKRVEFTLGEDVLARLDAARGFEPRASFVKRALESALGRSTELPPEASYPASSRASVEKGPEAVAPNDGLDASNVHSPAPSRPAV